MEMGFSRPRPGKQSLPAFLKRLVVYAGQLTGNVQLRLLPASSKGKFLYLSKLCFQSLQLLLDGRIGIQGDLK
jgi:hypothetical protein